jgi:poly(3-hydroxybutyrate) depolymerase
MKRFLCFLFLLCGYPAFSQELITEKEISYGKATDFHGRLSDLKFDIVYSSKANKLPLVVFTHGGGFLESSSKEGLLPFCERLANKGFAVANIEYRRGFTPSVQHYKTEIAKAVYRAEQDQFAALRYLIHNAAKFHIDTSLIFVGGASAGAVASLFTAYVSQDDWNHFMPTLDSTLGDISNSGNDLTDKFRLRGVIGMWGGIVDTAFISPEKMQATPVLLFHSIEDDEIPFELVSHANVKYSLLQGSKDIAARFKNYNGCYQFHFVEAAGHGYGFSGDYLVNSINKFVSDIRDGKCNSLETQNPERNITLGMFDSEDAAFPDEDEKIIKLPPEVLQQYAGKYQIDRMVVSNITVEGDHLNALNPDGEISKLYPLGNNMFIQKKFNLRVEFVQDSQGKVTEQIVRLNKNKVFNCRKIE